jgi:hypothetical protein
MPLPKPSQNEVVNGTQTSANNLPTITVQAMTLPPKINRIVRIMEQTSIAGATGILYDVMVGFQKNQWTIQEVRAILTCYNMICSIALDIAENLTGKKP